MLEVFQIALEAILQLSSHNTSFSVSHFRYDVKRTRHYVTQIMCSFSAELGHISNYIICQVLAGMPHGHSVFANSHSLVSNSYILYTRMPCLFQKYIYIDRDT